MLDPIILSAKYPVVDWESQNLGNVDMEDLYVYKIIKADGNTSYHKSLSSNAQKMFISLLMDGHLDLLSYNASREFGFLPSRKCCKKMFEWKLEAEAGESQWHLSSQVYKSQWKNEEVYEYISWLCLWSLQ
ncbi:hypothetical protein Tco_0178654 [Tanacetum coccineum]